MSAVVVDLPLVPVMATNGAAGAIEAALAAEQLDVADHLDAGRAGERDRPVRGGMRERHPGREHERGQPRPVDLAQIGGRDAGARRRNDGFRVVIPADDIGAAGKQRAGARQSRPAEAEDGDLFPGEGGDRNHAARFASRPLRREQAMMVRFCASGAISGAHRARGKHMLNTNFTAA